jgi:hypothetical protein
MELNDRYINGSLRPAPLAGRYNVGMLINGIWTVVLEKQIFDTQRGSNYLPVSILRYFKIPCMDFSIRENPASNEIYFEYHNRLIVDTLRNISYNTWLGKIFYKDKLIDWFRLKKR